MSSPDHRPLTPTPMPRRIPSEHDNDYDAVLFALHAFLVARQAATRNGAPGVGQDSSSVFVFDRSSEVRGPMRIEESLTATAGTYRGE